MAETNMTYDKCERCGKRLGRLSKESLMRGFFHEGDTYAPGIRCRYCGTRYRVVILFHVVWFGFAILGLRFIRDSGVKLEGEFLWLFIFVIGGILFLGYLLAWLVTPFTKV